MHPAPTIRLAVPGDALAIAAIYNHHVRETIVTFEEEPVAPTEMERRMREVQSAGHPWYVAEDDQGIMGYAYAGTWRARRGYRFSVESTVYVAASHEGRGIGTALYTALLADLRARGMHMVVGGIALPNDGSVKLHEKFGFKKVAHFEHAGTKFDRWIDVGYWQLFL